MPSAELRQLPSDMYVHGGGLGRYQRHEVRSHARRLGLRLGHPQELRADGGFPLGQWEMPQMG